MLVLLLCLFYKVTCNDSQNLYESFIKNTTSLVRECEYNFLHESDFAAVIIEPRNHPYMEYVLKNFACFLEPNFWSLYIFHGNKNLDFGIPNAHLINLNVDNYSIEQYNKLMKSKIFWEQIEAEKILIFQLDVFLIKRGIEEFVKYDWVGAPWGSHKGSSRAGCHKFSVGNGGLSIRSKSMTINAIEKYPQFINNIHTQDGQNEDMFYACTMTLLNASIPSIEDAKRFSTEQIVSDSYGCHACYKLHDKNILKQILEKITY